MEHGAAIEEARDPEVLEDAANTARPGLGRAEGGIAGWTPRHDPRLDQREGSPDEFSSLFVRPVGQRMSEAGALLGSLDLRIHADRDGAARDLVREGDV